jgi:inorganic pyrophosphatase
MNLKKSPFSILNKKRKEIDYIKEVYKRKIQAEIESYKDLENEDRRNTIQAQDVLMLDRISI